MCVVFVRIMEGISPDTVSVLRSAGTALDEASLGKLVELVFTEARRPQSTNTSTAKLIGKNNAASCQLVFFLAWF